MRHDNTAYFCTSGMYHGVVMVLFEVLCNMNINCNVVYVTLDHKTSLKSLGYICSNSQKYTVCVKVIDVSFMAKIIRTLSKGHVP